MKISRFLVSLAIVLAFGLLPQSAKAGEPIKIGFIEDYSGDIAIYGIQKLHAAQLAVKEINEGYMLRGGPIGVGGKGVIGKYTSNPPLIDAVHGQLRFIDKGGEFSNSKVIYSEEDRILVPSGEKGLLGRKVKLIAPDGQSQLRVWQQLARRLIKQEKVDLLMAGFTSASRESIRPIVDKYHQLYIYNNQYEGGVADKNTFCTGAVCEQQVIPVVSYMVEKYGPRIYTIAADYNFGQLTAAWTKASAPQLGGKVIGEEFVPLGVSEFSAVIERVKAANPDWVMSLMVGAAQQNYYSQAYAAGLRFPMASTINMAQGYEHVRFSPPAMVNMHNAVNYMMEIPTERNKAFVKRWFKMFPNDPYIGQMAQNTYFSIHLYANAVRLAGTTDQKEVLKAFESGMHIEAPEGTVFLEPATHHASHYIRLAKADKDHNITFLREWPMVEAWWLQRLGVNLVRHPEYKQYTPAEDPFFEKYGKK